MSEKTNIPFFSIIIPCYNQAHFLSDCLESLFCQEYKNWEAIIVNDGSTDNTKQTVIEFSKIDSRIKLVDKENGGLSSARNKGIQEANGDYFIFLDADDLLLNNCLKKYAEILQEKIDFIQSGYLCFVNNINNYTSAVSHELESVQYPNRPFKLYSTDWKSVTKTIHDDSDFGQELEKTNYFESDLNLILKGFTLPEEKIIAVFNFVKTKVKWDNSFGIFCSNGVKKAYTDKTGNVAEINLMLTSMLRYAGLEANPVLISTRSNGIAYYPTIAAFNYVVSAVDISGELVLLDATEKYSNINVLPYRDLNWI